MASSRIVQAKRLLCHASFAVFVVFAGLALAGALWFGSGAEAKCLNMANPVRAKIGDTSFYIPASFLPAFENDPERPKAVQPSYFGSDEAQTFGYCQDRSAKPFNVDNIYLIEGNTFQEALDKEYKNKFAYVGKRVGVSFTKYWGEAAPEKTTERHFISQTISPKGVLFGKPVTINCSTMDVDELGDLCRIIQPINNDVEVDAAYRSKEISNDELSRLFSEIEYFYAELTNDKNTGD